MNLKTVSVLILYYIVITYVSTVSMLIYGILLRKHHLEMELSYLLDNLLEHLNMKEKT